MLGGALRAQELPEVWAPTGASTHASHATPAGANAQLPPDRIGPLVVEAEDSRDAAPATGIALAGGDTERVRWFVLPIVGYSSDIGFGGALLGLVFHYAPGYDPYRDQVQIVAGLSTKLFQIYQLTWERVGLFHKPLRLVSSVDVAANPVGHYCGVGNAVSCDRAVAEAEAVERGLTPGTETYAEFVDRYYLWRATRIEGSLSLRWAPITDGPEFFLDWRGSYTIPGYIGESGNYPGSLFDQHFPEGERGLRSELKLGLVVDRRDAERRPSQGYLVTTAVRAAGRWIGSAWDYFGMNVGASGYVSLDPRRRWVLATRGIIDLLVGDAPTTALGSVGGFWSDVVFGGQFFGRGIRARRYMGRIKVLAQTELRGVLYGGPRGQWTMQAFVDAAWIGEDYDDFGGSLRRILVGIGGGTGVYWGKDFVIRFDAGFSPYEDWSPKFYLGLLHPY